MRNLFISLIIFMIVTGAAAIAVLLKLGVIAIWLFVAGWFACLAVGVNVGVLMYRFAREY